MLEPYSSAVELNNEQHERRDTYSKADECDSGEHGKYDLSDDRKRSKGQLNNKQRGYRPCRYRFTLVRFSHAYVFFESAMIPE